MKITLAIIDIIGIPYDGTTVFKQGLGGSESAVTFISRELTKLGFEVTVFNTCNIDHASPGVYDGVTYRPLAELAQHHEFDIVISSRTVIPFTDPNDYPKLNDNRCWPYKDMALYDRILSKAKIRALWMHDTFCLGDNLIEELAVSNRITDIFTLSDWHLTYIGNCHHGRRRNFEVLKNKFFITRNGVNLYHKQVDIKSKDRDLFVYNASVTKGMIPLVEKIWPHVKRHIPTARLKVIGGYYRFSSNDNPDEQELKWRKMSQDPKNAELGIEFTGVIPQKEIAEILTSANFMIYPAAFPETFGISTLESLCYNTPVITCRFGALEEIAVEGASYLIDYAIEPNGLFPDIDVPRQVEQFVKTTVEAYRNPYLHQQKQYYCNIVKDIAGWDSVAHQWRQHFYKKLGHYLSVRDYKTVSNINRRVHKIWQRRYHNTVEIENFKLGQEREIVVISTFYKCKEYIERCIQSVACQDYRNYRHILIDDASEDGTAELVESVLQNLPIEIRRNFQLIKNTVNVGAVYNQVKAIRSVENNEAIVILLDGDDSLVNDNTVFNYYNNLYDQGAEFTYGSCWSMVDNIPLISQPYPEEIKQSRQYRKHHFNWILPYTHLRTFKRQLMDYKDDSMFTDSQGDWYRAGGDGAVFYAMLERADPDKVICIQDIVMNYNDTNPLNDYKVNGTEQNKNARDIINKSLNTVAPVKKYSIIVPTMWRVADQFLEFLAKLCLDDRVGEIIIIDNDKSCRPDYGLSNKKIEIYEFGKNIYVNPAWNFGVSTAKHQLICILNDDVSFDLSVLEKLENQLTIENGVFGLCPGVSDFNQPPVTDKKIDVIPWTGQHTYGFGCLMFFNKAIWAEIPAGLEIYFGDNFIFDYQLSQGRTNYIIANMDFYSPFASTTKDTGITAGFLERERPIYEEIKKNFKKEDNHKMEPKKKILIAIPTAKYIEPETFKSIYDLIVPEGYQITFQYFYGYNIDQIRNLIADWVVKGFDYLFSVDSDIAFAPDTLKKLLSHDKDMVSGLYIQRKPGQHVLEIYEHNNIGGVTNIPYGKIKGRGLVEIASCGFGCVLVKSQVMKAVGYPQFVYHSAIDHRNTISEDVDFCKKALAKGFKIYADTSIKCRHIGAGEFLIDDNIKETPSDNAEPVAFDVPKRLRELGSQRLIPKPHVDYLKKLKSEGFEPKVIYDIGACVLHWTNEARMIWPTAEFFAFEAMPECEFLYRDQKIGYHIGVLSDQPGKEVEFYQNTYHPGGNSYYKENAEVNPEAPKYFNESHLRRYKTATLDSVQRLKKLPMPDLIKMDVQGAELDVLKGAKDCLARVSHVILELQKVEYNKGAPLREQVIFWMEEQGFECKGVFSDQGYDGDYHFVRKTNPIPQEILEYELLKKIS